MQYTLVQQFDCALQLTSLNGILSQIRRVHWDVRAVEQPVEI